MQEGRRAGHVKDILAEALPGLILQIYFPKTMYWTGKGGPRFIRPIRWIVALLGGEIVPFELAGVRSGALTSGHRRLGAREIAVTTADYEQRLRDHFVILSAGERRTKIMNELAGVRVKPDPALLETLVYLTEYPTPITGSFDPQFLELPEEVLVTVMRHHQKYFSVEDADGKLAPRLRGRDEHPVRSARAWSGAATSACCAPASTTPASSGRPIRRRSWPTACRTWPTSPSRRKLGSYLEKTERMVALVKELGGDAHAVRAAELAKCDLTTELVKEFTELQGVVGGLYARAQGEPEPVWQAIYDHYKPVSMEDSIPRNRTGQIVALADKLDTLRGCFRVGLIPTGSRDPFALRRAAQGVVKILVEGKLRAAAARPARTAMPELLAFFDDRVRYYFRDIRGFAYDEVNAAHGRRLERPGGSGSAPARAFRACGRRPISSRWPPASNASGTFSNRPNSRRLPAPSTNPCSSPARKATCTTNTAASPASPSRASSPGCAPRSICSSTRCW